ncbi:MAG TPA: hypothetical protein VN181_08985 [Thermoanaerobaculia bacterium]|nr:hypothetical protein [Thermoanaerobaculia bacterium]
MAEAIAVTGYVDDKVARQLSKPKWASVDVHPDRKEGDTFVRVAESAVRDVRIGSSRSGRTLVQLILNDEATFETVVRSVPKGQRFFDPTLARITAASIANKIEI